jgi:hypothetical protein
LALLQQWLEGLTQLGSNILRQNILFTSDLQIYSQKFFSGKNDGIAYAVDGLLMLLPGFILMLSLRDDF